MESIQTCLAQEGRDWLPNTQRGPSCPVTPDKTRESTESAKQSAPADLSTLSLCIPCSSHLSPIFPLLLYYQLRFPQGPTVRITVKVYLLYRKDLSSIPCSNCGRTIVNSKKLHIYQIMFYPPNQVKPG